MLTINRRTKDNKYRIILTQELYFIDVPEVFFTTPTPEEIKKLFQEKSGDNKNVSR